MRLRQAGIVVAVGVVVLAVAAYAMPAKTSPADHEIGWATVRAAIMGRGQFIPNEQLVVDRCALAQVLNPHQVDSLAVDLARFVKFTGCGANPQLDGTETHWKIAGIIGWWPATIIAADVSHPKWASRHRERYTVSESRYLAELSLSHYGVED